MSKSVFGIANTKSQAESIVDRLQSKGFPLSDISVFTADVTSRKDFGYMKSTVFAGVAEIPPHCISGGVLGLLTGIGLLSIPGVGPFIGGGPMMAALSDAGPSSSKAGIISRLAGLGVPRMEAARLETKLRRCNYLIAVCTGDSEAIQRGTAVFKYYGAEDISTVTKPAVTDPSTGG